MPERPIAPMTALLLVASLLPAPAIANGARHDVVVRVVGVEDARGRIRVAVCPEASFTRPHCPHARSVPARAGATAVRVPDVPAGLYAVQVHHDANGDGELDRRFFGVPEEGIGFSNGARIDRGPPAFAEAAVPIERDGQEIRVELIYW